MKNTSYHFNNWMKDLDDNRRLYSLFIPARESGVRFLGLGLIRDLYKGYRCIKCKSEFDYLAIDKFLVSNPSEFIIATGIRSHECDLYLFHPSMTIREVRGKLLYLRPNDYRRIEFVSFHTVIDGKIVDPYKSKLGSNVIKESYFIDKREDYCWFLHRFKGIYRLDNHLSLGNFIKMNYE